LHWAALLYAAGLVLHTADHLRRGLDVITPAVLWAGNLSTLLGVTAVGLVIARHRLAPLFAAITAIPIALGVTAVHLLPSWGALSDSFVDNAPGVTAFSWFVVLLEIVGALAMGIAGLAIVRTMRTRDSTPAV
jgi:hypothetical protein